MCDCKSYNRPGLGGDTDERSISVDLREGNNITVHEILVDSCIADAVKAVLSAGFMTIGSCCGHNEKLGKPSIIVSDECSLKELDIIEDILRSNSKYIEWDIFQWELIKAN